MRKILKLSLSFVLMMLISSMYFSKFFSNAASIVTNSYFEDFVSKSHHKMLFVEEDLVSKCYLIEGETPSYIMYDFDNNELLLYCQDSNSPWDSYTANLFSEFGYVYLYNFGYCIINLSKTNSYQYGDIVNIEGEMEIYVKNDTSLADEISEMISIPDTFNFANLFPENNVLEDVEISNAYYFKNLNKNIGENTRSQCTLIAFAGLLSYFDTFYDNRIIPDQYMNKEKVYNHHIENAISSPGGKLFYDYLLNEKIKETAEYQNIKAELDRGNYDPWYSYEQAKINVMTKELITIINNNWCTSSTHDENCTDCFSKNFEYTCFSNTHHPDVSLYKYTFEQLIGMGLPVVVEIDTTYFPVYSPTNDYVEYPVNYYIPEDGEWNSFINAGHAFICYGYLKVRDHSPEFGSYTTTYYKGHNGSRNADGTYRYTQVIYSNRYLNTDYGGDEVRGYTFIPKNNLHVCSKNYLYTKDDCSFGICPCDSKLSTIEFLNKYTNVVKIGNKDQYICKEHNNHILYESTHVHRFSYICNSESTHTQYCTVEGCTYSVQINHSMNSENCHNDNYHKEKCVCEFEKNVEHQFNHVIIDSLHYLLCSDCGYYKKSSGEYMALSDMHHHFHCQECGETSLEEHTILHEYYNESFHRRYCALCDYSELIPHGAENGWNYWTSSDGNVVKYCEDCGFEKKEN